ncbi:cysteine desulfurase [Bacillus oleivorans]|uniref:cysteine desulfurase n=1 Tax=Bacillus oleivorans TaxID=1448271 RepID=A0A285CXM5_9BACI|nr:cysteine desulfurase family protein [Bacillus oleivorans]SNX71693.1 cysteine desulfurase [Bacillus oleivorans]
MKNIYLDHAATSPVHPDVIERITKVMQEVYGNPSSIHAFGRKARQIVDNARTTIAKSIGCKYNEIIFTSGGTESDNLAIKGIAHAYRENGKHIITSSIEHHAVLHTCHSLEKEGYEVTYLPVNEKGMISIEDFQNSLRDDTIIVSIMFGNNEIGTIQPIAEIGEILEGHQAFFHTDAVQAYGLVPIDVSKLKLDALSVSAHKINGPKGTGFLYLKEGIKLAPALHGGEQERKRRAGTENVTNIAGFEEAVKLAQNTMEQKAAYYQKLKNLLMTELQNRGVHFELNGDIEHSLPHVINLSFPGIDVEAFLVNLDLGGVSVSSGSACTAGSIEPSHVLTAMFSSGSERLRNSIRFSFGLFNTEEDIVDAAEIVATVAKRLTSL